MIDTEVGTSESVCWEDFPVGRIIRSRGLTVTESHVVIWSMVAGDWVPLHVDAEVAAASRFGQRVAHGPLTLALALGLIVQTGAFGDAVVAWLGLDEVRATAPVFFDDTITVRVEVIDAALSSRPGVGKARLAYSVVNQRSEQVMTFSSSFLLTTQQNEVHAISTPWRPIP
jgi:itaconyl-CoA hydratase